MLLSRRRLLALGLAGSSALVLPRSILHGRDRPADRGQDTPGGVPSTRTLGSPPVEPFTRPLIIPPVLEPVATDEATDYYVLTMDQAQVEIIPGTFTTFWGYNGIYPGPTIKARTGRRTAIPTISSLPATAKITTIPTFKFQPSCGITTTRSIPRAAMCIWDSPGFTS